MHNNYFFLNFLVKELRSRIEGGRISEIYSQEKDVIIIHIITDRDFFIKAYLRGHFSCISFPEKLHRAKRNSVDLFPELGGNSISDIQMTEYDRSFGIVLEDDLVLLFKLHGQRGNIVLLKDGKVVSVFKNSLVRDKEVSWDELKRKLPDVEKIKEGPEDVRRLFPVLDQELADEVYVAGWEESSPEEKYKVLKLLVDEWDKIDSVWLKRLENEISLSIIPVEGAEKFEDPLKAVTVFSSTYLREYSLSSRRQSLETLLRQRLKRSYTYLKKTESQLRKVENAINPAEVADLVMANLHKFQQGARELDLEKFDGTGTVLVKIKGNQTPVQFAESLYRKSKNKKIELDTIRNNLEKKKKEIAELEAIAESVQGITDTSELDQIYKELKKESDKSVVTEFHEFEFDGFKIRVGKNARNNDKLTFGNGYKEDLWLHVKDARGSHVLLKYRSDRKFSKIAIEKAAQLAAWYSKRSTEGLVPVIFTPRKYVRKRKGDPAGMVVVDREEVLLVEPEKWG